MEIPAKSEWNGDLITSIMVAETMNMLNNVDDQM